MENQEEKTAVSAAGESIIQQMNNNIEPDKKTVRMISIRSWTNFLGVAISLIAGLIFILVVDLKAKIIDAKATMPLSAWLIIAILLAAGGAIFYYVGDIYKEKNVKTLVFKGVGMALVAGFIGFLFYFYQWTTTGELRATAVEETQLAFYISLVVAILGLITLIVNYVLSILYIEETY